MAHIALIITGLTGRLHSSFQMANKLQNEGHSITYLCPEDVKDKIETMGFNYVQLTSINYNYEHSGLRAIQSSSWYMRCKYHFKNYRKHYIKGVKVLHLDEYKTILHKLNPDHVIIDMELHDLIFVVTSLNIPTTLFTAWFSNKMGLGTILPPLRTDIIPGKGIKGSPVGILANWLLIKFKVQARIFINKLTFKDYRRYVLKKYAKTNGFPVHALISSNLPGLFCYTNLPILSLTLSEMDFPHEPAKNHMYIGPMIHEQREFNFDKKSNKIIDSIILEKKKSGKKLIYFSSSSLFLAEISFINKILKAVRNNDNWLVIISLGDKLSPEDFNPQQNSFLLSWVPQLKVLKNADCCITHAGANSLNECLHYKVPLLAYSGKKIDQNGNAARIHYHKIGIMRDRDKDSPEEIKASLNKILDDDSFKKNITFFYSIYQKYQQRKLSELLKMKNENKTDTINN